jgi:hypothetical protein
MVVWIIDRIICAKNFPNIIFIMSDRFIISILNMKTLEFIKFAQDHKVVSQIWDLNIIFFFF